MTVKLQSFQYISSTSKNKILNLSNACHSIAATVKIIFGNQWKRAAYDPVKLTAINFQTYHPLQLANSTQRAVRERALHWQFRTLATVWNTAQNCSLRTRLPHG